MNVLVMRVRHMRMRMGERLVHMPMAVRATRHHIVGVVVMAVVMPVCVFV
jgi:hypothetical protein